MNKHSILLAVALATLTSTSYAQMSKSEYNAETKRLSTRYASDKKLCAEESNSGARMQCLRDAKSEYDQHTRTIKTRYNSKAPQAAACHDCGRVTSVVVGEKAGEGGAVGLIAGGVAGALLGNQVGSGGGKKLATIAGAAGGAYAGKQVEGHARTTKQWTVHVKYDDGKQDSFVFDNDPQMGNGDRVQRQNGTLVRR
ncbi:MAG: glycine zipper 2TM domain-containing protein [Duganella sp.]